MTEAAARQQRDADDHATGLELARRILLHEAAALQTVARGLDHEFPRAVERIENCRGRVVVSGMGKAGLVGRKVAATLASTGTPSFFMHPSEALHGDLGAVRTEDVVLALSMSGRTDELVQVVLAVRRDGVGVVTITGDRNSPLASLSDVVLTLGRLREAGELGLAPTTSTTAMLALGDALALVVSERRGFTSVDFARNHPAGALGRRLARVEELMRPLDQCRVASAEDVLREVLVQVSRPGRRTGAIMLRDGDGRLAGIFTDSDLARLMEHRREAALDEPISVVMTRDPKSVLEGTPAVVAVELLAQRKLSELPVLDGEGRPLGLIDVTDLLDLVELQAPGSDGCQDSHGSQVSYGSESLESSRDSAGFAGPPSLRVVTPADSDQRG